MIRQDARFPWTLQQTVPGSGGIETLALARRIVFFMLLFEACSIASPAQAENGKFLGIRCGMEEECLMRAKELALNTVLANDSSILNPSAPDYLQKLEGLRRASSLAKVMDLNFFVGWNVLGRQTRGLIGLGEGEGAICVSEPVFWDRVIADPMERVVSVLSGPEYRLDGFLLDMEEYAAEAIQWLPVCGSPHARSLQAIAERAGRTREKLQTLRPGLRFGAYPIRLDERREVLWAWLRGMSQPQQPVFLLVEYTYNGYSPELDLKGKVAAYGSKVGNPIVLVPGFNFLKISEPQAWKMHLYEFAREADGYWLYPGARLVQKTMGDAGGLAEAFAAIRGANSEIRAYMESPQRTSPLDFRTQAPHESEKAHMHELLDLAAVLTPAPAAGDKRTAGITPAALRSGNVDLLIKAGPNEPIDFSVSGKGHFSVYDNQGRLKAMRAFNPKGVSLSLEVDTNAIYSVIVKTANAKLGASITVANQYWAFRGVSTGTSQGWTARFLQRPGLGPFYFYVPEGTKFFRMYISDKKRGSFAAVHDPEGREVLRQEAGFKGDDTEHARQDVEIPVFPGQDGKVWSVHGTAGTGLPFMVVYGIPDLFNPDPNRLLIVGKRNLEEQRQALDARRTIRNGEAMRLWIEAEELNGGPWRLTRAFPETSGKGAMFARGFQSALPLYGEITVPHQGNWQVWVRGLAAVRGSKNRSSRIEIANEFLAPTHRDVVDAFRLFWESAGVVRLEAGRSVLKIHPYPQPKGRPGIDAIVLCDDLEWKPLEAERR